MNDEQAKPYELPCVAILWYWNPWLKRPVVFPAARDPVTGEPKVLATEGAVDREMAELTTINSIVLQQGGPPYRVSLVPVNEAQAFIDDKYNELAGEMAERAEATDDGVYSRGIDDKHLRREGAPVRPGTKGETL